MSHSKIPPSEGSPENRPPQDAEARRLEGLGRLAGMMAHDFNNLLGAILNYAHFALEELDDRPTVKADVEAIIQSAERATDLTHQLLTFARKDRVNPRVIGLDAAVAEAIKGLRGTMDGKT